MISSSSVDEFRVCFTSSVQSPLAFRSNNIRGFLVTLLRTMPASVRSYVSAAPASMICSSNSWRSSVSKCVADTNMGGNSLRSKVLSGPPVGGEEFGKVGVEGNKSAMIEKYRMSIESDYSVHVSWQWAFHPRQHLSVKCIRLPARHSANLVALSLTAHDLILVSLLERGEEAEEMFSDYQNHIPNKHGTKECRWSVTTSPAQTTSSLFGFPVSTTRPRSCTIGEPSRHHSGERMSPSRGHD
jgi:hypothetical protein